MLEYRFVPYVDKDGNKRYKTVKIQSFKTPEEYDKALKEHRIFLKKKSFHKKIIKFYSNKISQPQLYPTKNLWDEFIRIVYGLYQDGLWEEFKKEMIKLARVLAIRD